MKTDFLYSTDFYAMNATELSHTCMHLLCTAGEGSFVFNERCYHIVKNDLVVIPHPDRTAYIVKQLMALLSTGISCTERDVSYYARHLNVSPKYLSATVKRMTGHSVTSYIDRHTVPILKACLDDERLSLTQIADRMNFASLSYFSRYCTKHLGQSPSEYRRSLQPK
ncbi:MAG: helix-turn-helix domain-containing protein [Bacteroidales bacterium]|nr:helix-turn-helix domain-containing protein [Bacteroidales bacterium]